MSATSKNFYNNPWKFAILEIFNKFEIIPIEGRIQAPFSILIQKYNKKPERKLVQNFDENQFNKFQRNFIFDQNCN